MEYLFVIPILAIAVALCLNLNEINPWKEHKHRHKTNPTPDGPDGGIPVGVQYQTEEEINIGTAA